MNYLIVTYLPHHTTYVAELARKGCRKINYSAMPAIGGGADERIFPRQVPLSIRRAAKAALLGA